MDIDLLSKMVKELILVNDRVTLPGIGAFVAEMVPASFSDRGYTINPPYRRLAFRQGSSQEKDSLLVELYASANGIEASLAEKLLRDFLTGMAEELKQRKMLLFPGLGRLRATKENNFFFICDEELDIYPEGIGLEALSLKSHSKPESLDFSEIDSVVGPAASVVGPAAVAAPAAAAPAPAAEESTGKESAAPAEVSAPVAAAPAVKRKSIWKRAWFICLLLLLSLVLLTALAYGGFLLLAKYAPDFTDSLLYTKEELELLNYRF